MQSTTVAVVTLLVGLFMSGAPVSPGARVAHLDPVTWISGEPVAAFEPGRVYVLEFWSTWCGACVESFSALNDLARRHEADATFIAVHIWQRDGAPTPAEFMKQRRDSGKPVPECCVAEDVDGDIARAWMDATYNSGLPTAMIVDRESRLVWFGHARDVQRPLSEVIAGTFDVDRSVADMNRRMRVGRLANESSAAIEAGDYERGAAAMLEALAADPEAVADWIPSTYGHLLAASRSQDIAGRFAREVLAGEAGKRRTVLVGLAHAILHFQPKELRDLDLALRLTREAGALSLSFDAQLRCLEGRIRAEQGDIEGATGALQRALHDAPDEAARKMLTDTLEDLRRE